jgi:DNA-binding MarR family transcriptional regulator
VVKTYPSTGEAAAADALRTAGSIILLARALEGELRIADPGDGLTLPELGVLGQIDRGRDLPSVLARALRIDPGRVTRITDRLVALAYLERAADPDDRRRCPLRLTVAGQERLARARSDVASAMGRLLDDLADRERIALHTGLEAARGQLEARD